jgi:hypothetical protein
MRTSLTEPTNLAALPPVSFEKPPPMRTAVAEAVKDPTIGSKAIAQFLQKRGINVPAYSVARHRRGDCACNRG